jgi:hypothetical protein
MGLLAYLSFTHVGLRMSALAFVGAALGLTLHHAGISFTGAWRSFLERGRGGGLRAQMAMLALATLLFLPLLAHGTAFGRPLAGAIAPVGVSVVVGAFIFGIGMQFCGSCASGTLLTAGSGNTRAVITLAFFIVGSLLGSLHMPWWLERPGIDGFSLSDEFGLSGAIAVQAALLAAIAGMTLIVEWRRHGRLETPLRRDISWWRIALRGPWPIMVGAVGLALLNVGTLVLAGHPWNISFGFTLWGAKLAGLGGIDVSSWTFWTWPYPQQALRGSVFAESTSVTNMGLVLGALLGAGLSGGFAPILRLPARAVAAAVLGGLLMGYGARLAFGCNIGALFSGIASGSAHGWVWLAAALAGSYIGLKLGPLFAFSARATPSHG